ncbi:MAG TPA: peptide chain release factor 1 [Polyangiaceae bacterium LLY-WYZ-14_1]|jgi:peptide chain release factor 1|nr:peptide chain release factor 1 [Polyangiaceae bacterium LLY-WYZ-14_1]
MLPREKLDTLAARHRQLEELLCRPEVIGDTNRFQSLNKERSELAELVATYERFRDVERRTEEDRQALDDPELRELAAESLRELDEERGRLEAQLELLLLPKDPHDERDTILEIRAGAGGEEAALFASDLFRMFGRYAERRGWRVELLSSSEASAGGFKEVVASVRGDHVYSDLKFEAGVHRVQRVPATETQGRVHTSTATVAVLPEADEVDVQIRDEDLEVHIAAAGGPGGQGVNTTNSAVQIQHKPSGLIVKCQDERSQIKNKARALQVLRARLLERERAQQAEAISAERRGMVGSGDRAEKIRTYNYPQNRVTDHRIGLTLHKLEGIVDGDLDELHRALKNHAQAELLRAQAARD